MAEYLFHYTTLDTALDHILKNGTLRLSPFAILNDPKEVDEWISYVASTHQHAIVDRYSYKVLCFSQGGYSDLGFQNPLESGWAMGNMWAHYTTTKNINGCNEGGVCLIFDKAKLEACFQKQFDSYKTFHHAVVYNDDLIVHSDAQASNPDDSSVVEYLLFHKFCWWSNEKEYRWVVKGNDNNIDNLFLEYGKSLTAIVVGKQVPCECRPSIYIHCCNGIKVYDFKSHNGMPYLSEHLV